MTLLRKKTFLSSQVVFFFMNGWIRIYIVNVKRNALWKVLKRFGFVCLWKKNQPLFSPVIVFLSINDKWNPLQRYILITVSWKKAFVFAINEHEIRSFHLQFGQKAFVPLKIILLLRLGLLFFLKLCGFAALQFSQNEQHSLHRQPCQKWFFVYLIRNIFLVIPYPQRRRKKLWLEIFFTPPFAFKWYMYLRPNFFCIHFRMCFWRCKH